MAREKTFEFSGRHFSVSLSAESKLVRELVRNGTGGCYRGKVFYGLSHSHPEFFRKESKFLQKTSFLEGSFIFAQSPAKVCSFERERELMKNYESVSKEFKIRLLKPRNFYAEKLKFGFF